LKKSIVIKQNLNGDLRQKTKGLFTLKLCRKEFSINITEVAYSQPDSKKMVKLAGILSQMLFKNGSVVFV
jgi:hypothetical protein